MSFSRQHKRKGNLFQRPFKRVEINKDSHFTQAIIYIHANAPHHKICIHFTEHPWSSWRTMLSEKPTHLKRNEVLEWFGGRQKFIDSHNSMTQYYYGGNIAIED